MIRVCFFISIIFVNFTFPSTNAQADTPTCSFAKANAVAINNWLASSRTLGTKQNHLTRIIFTSDSKDVSEIILVFMPSGSRTNSKCEDDGNDKWKIIIEYTVGQLPLILDLWERARDRKKTTFFCQYSKDGSNITGLCNINGNIQ